MSEQDEKAWADERKAASEWLTKAIKPTGQIHFLDDGKEEVYLKLTLPEMVTLLASWGVERMCQSVVKVFGENIEGI